MIVSPQGQGARSTLDRMGHAILFLVIGLPILVLDAIIDIMWFVLHLYKMDLEKAVKMRNQADGKELQMSMH